MIFEYLVQAMSLSRIHVETAEARSIVRQVEQLKQAPKELCWGSGGAYMVSVLAPSDRA